MRLAVTYEARYKDGSCQYIIHGLKNGDSSQVPERIADLQPRIKAMAEREFGEDFISLELMPGVSTILELRVRAGMTNNRRFEKRAFFGWVMVFDDEPQVSV